jgi:hypothetical protein
VTATVGFSHFLNPIRVIGGTLDGQELLTMGGARVEVPFMDDEYNNVSWQWQQQFGLAEAWFRAGHDDEDYERLEKLYTEHPKPRCPVEVYEYRYTDDGTLVLMFDRIER